MSATAAVVQSVLLHAMLSLYENFFPDLQAESAFCLQQPAANLHACSRRGSSASVACSLLRSA